MGFSKANVRAFAALAVLALLNAALAPAVSASAPPSGGARRHFSAALREQARSLGSSADKTFRYGLDADKVPFALKADGVKGRFIDVSPNHFKLQIVKGESLGEVEFVRMTGGESALRFSPAGGEPFIVRTKNLPGEGGAPRVAVGFQFGRSRSLITLDGANEREPVSPAAAKRAYRMLEGLRHDRRLKGLMEETRAFASGPVVNGVMAKMLTVYAYFDSLDCLIDVGECILMIGTYIASVGGLIALCPETIGASCLAALLLHPVIGAMVALKCAKAVRTCGVQKPPPPPPPPPCPNTFSYYDPYSYYGGYGGFMDPYGFGGDYGWYGDYGSYGGFGDPFGGFESMAPMLDMWGWSWLDPFCDPFGGYLPYLYY